MVEVTEHMKELGITQEVFRKWQEENDPGDEPGPFLMPSDTRTLDQRRAAGTAKQPTRAGPMARAMGTGSTQTPRRRQRWKRGRKPVR